MTISFYWQKLVHATDHEYHLQKKIANVIYGGILKQNDYCSVTMRAQPPLIFLSGEQKGGSA